MLKLGISNHQIDRAKKLYEFGALKNSITKGKSNIYGALGEIVVMDFFKEKGSDIIEESSYDYDMIINSKKIDVKTKRTTVEPKENYNCSVAAVNTKQDTDYYLFVRITEDKKTAYILGAIKKSEFFKNATFNKKGEPDGNGFSFRDDCYNLKIKDLHKISL